MEQCVQVSLSPVVALCVGAFIVPPETPTFHSAIAAIRVCPAVMFEPKVAVQVKVVGAAAELPVLQVKL